MNYKLKLTFKDFLLFILSSYLFVFYYYTYRLFDKNLIINIIGVALIIYLLPTFINKLMIITSKLIGKIVNIYKLFNNDCVTILMILVGFITFIMGIILYSFILFFVSVLLIFIGAHI